VPAKEPSASSRVKSTIRNPPSDALIAVDLAGKRHCLFDTELAALAINADVLRQATAAKAETGV